MQYLESAKSETEGMAYKKAITVLDKGLAILLDQTARMHSGGATRQHTIIGEVGSAREEIKELTRRMTVMEAKLDVSTLRVSSI